MSKQIHVKSLRANEGLLSKMYDEAQKYLATIGFAKEPMLSVTDDSTTFRGFLFTSGFEKVMVEYKKDMYEEVLRLTFSPLEIRVVYDIILMRFNQIAGQEKESVFIFND